MELRQLRYALAAAEELHMGRAAARMHITQPAFTQQIRRLERELGVQLFDVSSHGVSVTAAGRGLLEEARRTLAHAEEAAGAARRAGRGEVGQLSVGFVTSAARQVLPPALATMRGRYPDVVPILREMWTAEQTDALRRARLDVGFVLGGVVDPQLRNEVVAVEPFVALLPAGHRLIEEHPGDEEPVTFGELVRHPWTLFRRELNPLLHDRLLGLARAQPTMGELNLVDHAAAIGVLVAAGLGVGIASASRARRLNHPHVVVRPIIDPEITEAVRMVWRHDDSSPVLAVFRRVVHEASHPPGSR